MQMQKPQFATIHLEIHKCTNGNRNIKMESPRCPHLQDISL